METSENSTHVNTGELWTSSQADSPANPFQLQENERAKMMTATSGQKLVGLLQKSGPAGLFLKMLLDSSPFSSGIVFLKWKSWRRSFFVRTENTHRPGPFQDYSEESLEALFQKSDQRDIYFRNLKTEHQSFCVFQLVPSGLRTEGTEYGLLPTPRTVQIDFWKVDYQTGEVKMAGNGNTQQRSIKDALLEHEMKKGLIPTVTAIDSTGATARMKSTEIKLGSMHSMTLSRFVAMLPTPMASDWKGPHRKGYTGNGQRNLSDTVRSDIGMDGHLNPRFVAEMMGFPVDWTELPFLNGECKA